jgi:non-ribosomal peptide synthetase component F
MHLSELGPGDAGAAGDPHRVEDSRYDVKSASFDAPVHRAFESLARRQPDALAVVFDAERVTYRELNERANRLARHLLALGVGAETTVGVFVDRSVDLIVSFWAVL